MQFDWSAIWPAIPILLEGAKMTLWISVLGLVGGLIIGLVAGFARCFRRLDCQPHRAGLYRNHPRHPDCGAGHVHLLRPADGV
jgi:ABC-type amino acid transport system permease subunit